MSKPARSRKERAFRLISLITEVFALIALAVLLYQGTEHPAPCAGCDCTRSVDRPCR